VSERRSVLVKRDCVADLVGREMDVDVGLSSLPDRGCVSQISGWGRGGGWAWGGSGPRPTAAPRRGLTGAAHWGGAHWSLLGAGHGGHGSGYDPLVLRTGAVHTGVVPHTIV
jgi:hypothetical protein